MTEMIEGQRMKGVIKALKKDSGYGFLRDEIGQDRFFHANHVEETTFQQLQEGLAVEFEPYEEPGKGLRAREVRIIEA